MEAGDGGARAAAIRETLEEVGLRLDRSPYLGSLEVQPVRAGGKPTDMSLSSFVFHLGETLEQFTPSDEVAEAFWVPLRHLLDPRNAARKATVRDGHTVSHPAILYQGHYIWGLTHRLLAAFFAHMHLRIALPD